MKTCKHCGGNTLKDFNTTCVHDFDEAPEPFEVVEVFRTSKNEKAWVARIAEYGVSGRHPLRQAAVDRAKAKWREARDKARARDNGGDLVLSPGDSRLSDSIAAAAAAAHNYVYWMGQPMDEVLKTLKTFGRRETSVKGRMEACRYLAFAWDWGGVDAWSALLGAAGFCRISGLANRDVLAARHVIEDAMAELGYIGFDAMKPNEILDALVGRKFWEAKKEQQVAELTNESCSGLFSYMAWTRTTNDEKIAELKRHRIAEAQYNNWSSAGKSRYLALSWEWGDRKQWTAMVQFAGAGSEPSRRIVNDAMTELGYPRLYWYCMNEDRIITALTHRELATPFGGSGFKPL